MTLATEECKKRNRSGVRALFATLGKRFVDNRVLYSQKIIAADFVPVSTVNVEAVAGRGALLPCDIQPDGADDRVYMVLWFRHSGGKPLYSTFDNKTWQPNKNTRICSAHFVGGKQSNVENSPAYVPTIFPPRIKKRKHNWP
ncbi:hypothetical protein EVAR_3916_1 [Eumeta japonica]|uniref:THAP-type domain-containing protein n=1 Tax=Eumeta variegata TaxID=151549 RepID=A0A4C1STA7_EUMVA|nr:hypothetical protein EVAR_3916_1 [Eumeta japonica]